MRKVLQKRAAAAAAASSAARAEVGATLPSVHSAPSRGKQPQGGARGPVGPGRRRQKRREEARAGPASSRRRPAPPPRPPCPAPRHGSLGRGGRPLPLPPWPRKKVGGELAPALAARRVVDKCARGMREKTQTPAKDWTHSPGARPFAHTARGFEHVLRPAGTPRGSKQSRLHEPWEHAEVAKYAPKHQEKTLRRAKGANTSTPRAGRRGCCCCHASAALRLPRRAHRATARASPPHDA